MHLKKKFIQFALKNQAIQFGNFKLKSGRNSPYFFNSSCFYTGKNLIKLGKFYASLIQNSKINFDSLFGLSYKGIPIAATTAMILKQKYNLNKPFFFNRKIFKNYSEKGILVDNNCIKNKIIIIDDVMTSGKTVNESIKVMNSISSEIEILAIFCAFDRKENENNKIKYKIDEKNQKNSYQLFSIINIIDVIEFLKDKKIFTKHIKQIKNYYKKYGSEILKS
ncbi:orotate phosphoribosyltransferase [Buchnera aphidicola]|uniref:orotate phosphoribosyltransferase n=1 Tax=Buchnera aphidicola TaxID=9 RepID=UPI00346485F3